MSTPDRMAFAVEEREELLALLRSLTPEQWEAASLCSQWWVRDVALHVVSYEAVHPEPGRTFLRGACGSAVSTT